MQSIYDLEIEKVVNDIKDGVTCVLMKPKGIKMMVSSPPRFNIMDKRFRPLNVLDLLSTDLCINPYMHFHKIKSVMVPNENYEIVYNYDTQQIFLLSIKAGDRFINDYRALFHRVHAYDAIMPSIPNLDMEALISLISNPEELFDELEIKEIANAVMFLNEDYQAILRNPHKEEIKKPSELYIHLVGLIIKNRPDSLNSNIKDRFIDIWNWCERVRTEFNTDDINGLGVPTHVLTLQDFTLTFLPKDLYNFLRQSELNVVIFRLILFMLSGKGYVSAINQEVANDVKKLNDKLDWAI